jgi:inorganic triphosphatase YgiF
MNTLPREVELKLEFDHADAGRIKRRLSLEGRKNGRETQKLVSVYFDTPDLRLQQGGMSLRVRRIGKKHTQTIKSGEQGGVLADRAEWEQDIPGPLPDLAAARGTGLDSLLDELTTESLRPVFETRVERTSYRLERRGARIEAALDVGEVDTGENRVPVCELEFELLRGGSEELFQLAKAIGERVPLRLSVKTKADRGYALIRNESNAVAKAEAVRLAPTMTCEEAFRIVGRNCLAQLVANESVMPGGDSEALHQMRIALRRLRAAISTFSEVLADNECERIKGELKWITGELGAARDLDVFVAEVLTPLRQQNPKQPGLGALNRDIEGRRTRAHNSAAEAVRSQRFRTLVLDTAQWLEAGPWTKDNDDLRRLRRHQPVAALAADELARHQRKIRKKGKSLRHLDAPERHKLRIRGKKLRYAIEFLADVFPGKKSAKRRAAALSSLKELQDALGGLNDIAARERLVAEVVLSKRPRSNGRAAPERAFAGGVIFGSQEAHQERMLAAAETAYARFRKVKPFWK